MVREQDRPGVDGYSIRTLVMESGKEHQEWSKCLPPTEDVPTTHEHNIVHKTLPDGRIAIEITVSRKAGKVAPEPDELNKLDDAGLETAAGKLEMDLTAFKKLDSKSKKVKAIREARAKKDVANVKAA